MNDAEGLHKSRAGYYKLGRTSDSLSRGRVNGRFRGTRLGRGSSSTSTGRAAGVPQLREVGKGPPADSPRPFDRGSAGGDRCGSLEVRGSTLGAGTLHLADREPVFKCGQGGRGPPLPKVGEGPLADLPRPLGRGPAGSRRCWRCGGPHSVRGLFTSPTGSRVGRGRGAGPGGKGV